MEQIQQLVTKLNKIITKLDDSRSSVKIKTFHQLLNYILIDCDINNFTCYFENVGNVTGYNNIIFNNLFVILESFGIFRLLENNKFNWNELKKWNELTDLNNCLRLCANDHMELLFENGFESR